VAYTLTDKEIKTLKNSVDLDDILAYLKENKELNKSIKSGDDWSDIKFYKPKGCEQCGGEGYRGRVGIFEVLDVDTDIGKMIVESASTEAIEKKSREKGMVTMAEDGFFKVVQGTTSIEEVLRVTKE
jgi:type II secretory ATPase GspE/PulE/Tfp pilus assembly ATPase PilB-like protein